MQLTQESIEKIKEMIREYGFDKIVIIPDLSPNDLIGQDSNGKYLNEKFISFNNPNSPEDQRTGSNKVVGLAHDAIKASTGLKKKPGKFKIIFFKDKTGKPNAVDTGLDYTVQKVFNEKPELLKNIYTDKIEKTTINKTYQQIMAMESYLKLDMMDELTAMIIDREHYDKTGKHLFLDTQQVWLTETANKYAVGHCASFNWSSTPGIRVWFLHLYEARHPNILTGSVFSCSLSFETD